MGTIFAKAQGSLYRATVIANSRYRDEVLSLQAMSLTDSVVGHFVRVPAAKKNSNSHRATDRNCQNEPTTCRVFMRQLNRLSS